MHDNKDVISCYSDLLSRADISISEALNIINKSGKGILFLLSFDNRVISCITDGDIRRYLLSGGELTGNAIDASNHHPIIAESVSEARQLFHDMLLDAVPVVNKEGEIVDLYIGKDNKEHASLGIPVVINAGGKGTRLSPFTKVLPKPLIPVGEIPIIELIMRGYQSYACEEFHIIVNYKKELIKAYFSDSGEKYRITWYDEDRPLGTGGGLALLRRRINNTFFFANCDTLLTTDYESVLQFHRTRGNAITMVCANKVVNIPYGVVEIDDSGAVKSMTEKPQLSFLTNTGNYLVEPEVIDAINDNETIGFPDIIERVKQSGKKVAVFSIEENDWMDMGQLPELEKMRLKMLGEDYK